MPSVALHGHYWATRHAGGAYSALVLEDGASHYWRLNETSGTTAVDMLGGADGTISGGVTLNQAGALTDGDAAMAFDGNLGIVQVPAGVLPDEGLLSWTWELWAKLDTPQGDATLAALFDNEGTATPGGTNLYMEQEVTGTWFEVDVVTTAGLNVGALSAVSPTPVLGQWRHLVVVLDRDADTVQLYLDAVAGTAVAVDPTWDLSGPPDAPFGIGRFNVPGPVFLGWIGVIDDVAIYPYALTAAQVSHHYAVGNSQSAGGASSVGGHFFFVLQFSILLLLMLQGF